MHLLQKKHIFLVFIFLNSIAYGQIIANFAANDSIGCNSLIVQFTNTTQGAGTMAYQWDFGNGVTSTVANPQIVFNSYGSFTVSLIAYNQDFADTLTKTNYIVINKSPVITNLLVDNTLGCVPFATEFEALIDTGNASVDTYIWDFGDGTSDLLDKPSHTYLQNGSFNVTLYIQDTNKCNNSFSSPNLITAIAKPIINFKSTTNVACVDTLTVGFTNKSNGTTALSFLWDFGNGNGSDLDSPVQFYSGFNNYSVSLTGTDTYGCTNTLVKADYVNLQELIASVEFPDKYLCKNEELQITNNTLGANKYYWDYGDNTTSNLRDPVKSYVDTGSFEIVYVCMLNNSCSDTIKTEIYVDPLSANFGIDKNYGCEFPFAVQYIDSSVNAANWLWLLGNHTQSNLQNPKIDYLVDFELEKNRNIYLNDTLIVESAKQCKDTLVIERNIHLHLPKVYFTPNDSAIYNAVFKGCIPMEINFQNKSVNYFDEDPFESVEWSFGDQTTSTQNNPDHNYAIDGDYNVSLAVTNQSGCTNTYSALLLAGTPQQAKFSYLGNAIICGSEITTFTNQSTNDTLIDEWKWLFTDGTTTKDKMPIIQLKDTGYISGELTVFYNGCEGSTFKLDSFIFVNGPAGDYKISLNCDGPLKYYFESDVNGADFWYFAFGDGSFDSTLNQNMVHEYAGTGNYSSFVEARNIENSCNLHVEREVLVRQLKADFSFSEPNLCPFDTVTFNPQNSVDNTFWVYDHKVTKYYWNFYEEAESEISFESIEHNFEKPGTYNISLLAKDVNGCKDSIVKSVRVFNIEANYSLSDSVGCAPIQVLFTDQTVSDTNIQNWFWDFGNSNTDTIQSPTQVFYNDTGYTVKLIVTDVLGCKDTLIKEKAIFSSNPIPNFNAIKTKNCLYDSVTFLNNSQGIKIKSYLWDFGNGETSNEYEPKIPYLDTGYFNISLTLIDSLGCDSTIEKPNYIYLQPLPVADFSVNTYSSACYPKVVGFTDISASNDIVYRYWKFGDNEISSNTAAPYHTYQQPGLFDVSLIVSTSVGCNDTIVKNGIVEIGGPYAKIIAPDTACINLPISIEFADSMNINKYQWTLDDGTIFQTNPFLKTYESFGMKKVYLNMDSDTLGTCNKLIVDSINIPVLTADFAIMDTAECTPFQSITQNTSFNASNFEWYIGSGFISNDTDIDVNLIEPGKHSLKLVAVNSATCRDSMIKDLTVYPLPIIGLNNDTLICQYDSIWLNAYNGVNYWWFMQQKPIDSLISSINVFPNSSTTYMVKVLDKHGCFNIDSTHVQVQPKPLIKILNNDTTIIIGQEIELKTEINYADEIIWEPADYLNCINCASTLAIPLESLTYHFYASDYNNCFLIADSVQIKVDAKYSVDLPNSFTPNGDGVNDFVYVRGWGIKQLLSFIVYDMDGRIVFETNDIRQAWDGNSILGRQPAGMYLYKVNILSYDNIERSKQGSIYLIR